MLEPTAMAMVRFTLSRQRETCGPLHALIRRLQRDDHIPNSMAHILVPRSLQVKQLVRSLFGLFVTAADPSVAAFER
jgi:hypothetical protein